jgi:transcriptional regulator with XRE-family HTH domain
MDFGNQLRDLRTRHGLSKSELAQASALSESIIDSLEAGHQIPWPSTRRALARAFRVSVEDFEARLAAPLNQSDVAVGVANPAATGASSDSEPGSVELPSETPSRHQSPASVVQNVLTGTPAAAKPAGMQYAPAKVMELLNRLGEVENELIQYQTFVRSVCAACWTTDAALHLTNLFGSLWTDRSHLKFVGRHVSEFFGEAWGVSTADMLPLLIHQKAADGQSASFNLESNGARYAIYVDPRFNESGKAIGTVGAAIDISYREMAIEGS